MPRHLFLLLPSSFSPSPLLQLFFSLLFLFAASDSTSAAFVAVLREGGPREEAEGRGRSGECVDGGGSGLRRRPTTDYLGFMRIVLAADLHDLAVKSRLRWQRFVVDGEGMRRGCVAKPRETGDGGGWWWQWRSASVWGCFWWRLWVVFVGFFGGKGGEDDGVGG